MMLLLWGMLLALQRGYTLAPVTTAQLGKPVTLICEFPSSQISRRKLLWYKQSTGDSLQLIKTEQDSIRTPYQPVFSDSRLEVNTKNNISNLTILRTIHEDEGMYHCANNEWLMDTEWKGTYLFVNGNDQRKSSNSVVQWPAVSEPVHPGDPVTLQCSVLSDSDDKTCPADQRMFWFKAGSDKSHSNVLYIDGNTQKECNKTSDNQKSCFYRFSKKVSASDSGTYYCAVATCGEILFGNGTKLEIEGTSLESPAATTIFILYGVLGISLVVIALLIYAIKCDSYAAVAVQEYSSCLRSEQRDKDTWVYSAVVFTVMKTGRGAEEKAKAVERERIYAAVKAFGSD